MVWKLDVLFCGLLRLLQYRSLEVVYGGWKYGINLLQLLNYKIWDIYATEFFTFLVIKNM